MTETDFSRIDHLIFGTPALSSSIASLEQKLGVRLSVGGQHPNFGTHNALVKIGAGSYLEVIAPDPSLAPFHRPLWMGLDQLSTPGLIWWAAKADQLESSCRQAKKIGWDLGNIMTGSRQLPDDTVLSWQLTDPFQVQEAGILPFLIDWGMSPHPTDNLPAANFRLVDFQLWHPQPVKIATYLSAIGLKVKVNYSPESRIQAGFSSDKGLLYL